MYSTIFLLQHRSIGMNEVLQKLLPVIAFLALFFPACAKVPPITAGKSGQDSQIVIATRFTDISAADIARVRKEAEKGLHTVPRLLGIVYTKKIKITIIEKGICRTTEGRNFILLPIWHIKNKRAAIIHEISHVIATTHENNSFFSEGLAVFLQYKFGEDRSALEFYNEPPGFSLHDLVRKYQDTRIRLSDLKNNNAIFKNMDEPLTRKLAYTEAGSFITFLYDVYGAGKLRDLYAGRPLNYKRVYGKNFRALETEWLSYLSQEKAPGVKI